MLRSLRRSSKRKVINYLLQRPRQHVIVSTCRQPIEHGFEGMMDIVYRSGLSRGHTHMDCYFGPCHFPHHHSAEHHRQMNVISTLPQATLVPNFQTSSTIRVPSGPSFRTTRSASIPALRPPFRFTIPSPSIFAGVLVTQPSASATEQFVHFLKLLTQSMSSIALPASLPFASSVNRGPFLIIRSPLVHS